MFIPKKIFLVAIALISYCRSLPLVFAIKLNEVLPEPPGYTQHWISDRWEVDKYHEDPLKLTLELIDGDYYQVFDYPKAPDTYRVNYENPRPKEGEKKKRIQNLVLTRALYKDLGPILNERWIKMRLSTNAIITANGIVIMLVNPIERIPQMARSWNSTSLTYLMITGEEKTVNKKQIDVLKEHVSYYNKPEYCIGIHYAGDIWEANGSGKGYTEGKIENMDKIREKGKWKKLILSGA